MDQCRAFVPTASSVLEFALKTSGGAVSFTFIHYHPYSMRHLPNRQFILTTFFTTISTTDPPELDSLNFKIALQAGRHIARRLHAVGANARDSQVDGGAGGAGIR